MGNQTSKPEQATIEYYPNTKNPPSILRNADIKRDCEKDEMRRMAYEDAMSRLNQSNIK